MVAEHSPFDPLREYLEGLTWDGAPRVEEFASIYLGVEKGNGYARTVSLRWLVSSVARALSPGVKVDTMPILEGPQGKRKSAAVQALYGKEFYTDGLSAIGSKDALMEQQGVWGIEVAEMHRFGVAETNHVKQFLTTQVDRFRPPYGRSVIEAPRRAVMVGTINPEGNGYLRDATGNRRFWPLACGAIDKDAIERDRDQIWAEAVKLYRDGVEWWVQEDELAHVEAEQEKRSDVDPLSERVSEIVRGLRSISQWDILNGLGLGAREADTRFSMRIGRIMLKLGWRSHRERKAGQDRMVYRSPDYEPGGIDGEGW
jgi:predicted P-loop ATPase